MASKCSYDKCGIEIGFFEREYICSSCGKIYCDNHIANSSYFLHLKTLDDKVVENDDYICVDCISKIKTMPLGWKRSFIDRKCSYKGCTTNLHDWTTIKRSCIKCGLIYCSAHSHGKNDAANSWLEDNTNYPNAESICDNCMPSEEKQGYIARQASTITKSTGDLGEEYLEKYIQKAQNLGADAEKSLHDHYVGYGMRGALAALSTFAIIYLAPKSHDVLMGEELFTKLWYMLTLLFAGIFLIIEFVLPALKSSKNKKYAITFIVFLFVFIGYQITSN